MGDEQHVNANQECFYHKYRPGHKVYKVQWAPQLNGKLFDVEGPFEITAALFSIAHDGELRRRYTLSDSSHAKELDLFFDVQAAIAEAYLRDEKEKQHHAET